MKSAHGDVKTDKEAHDRLAAFGCLQHFFQAYLLENIPRKYGLMWYSSSILGSTVFIWEFHWIPMAFLLYFYCFFFGLLWVNFPLNPAAGDSEEP